jgi:membrane protease subunit (stomatin/prohibitin family)
MSVADFVKKQFIDILEWTEADDDTLVWRYPTADFEIQHGAQLVVRETQAALFVDQGRVADLFGPGRHTLATENLPVLTDLRHWTKGFRSPFKSEVYFFSTRLRLAQTWGTPQPIAIRDAEFGALRVRAFGIYSYRIADPRKFHANVSGTRDAYRVADLDGQLRSTLVTTLTTHIADSGVRFVDMAANQTALAAAVRAKAAPVFDELGLALDGVQIQSISLPEELEERLDERIGMGLTGDVGRYTQYQLARSIPLAAAAGGTAGAGVGVGAGVAMGQAMVQAIGQQNGNGAKAPTQACPKCSAQLAHPGKFCSECGASLA